MLDQAPEQKSFSAFLRERKKYWLAPVVITLVLVGGIILLTQHATIIPFIYKMF